MNRKTRFLLAGTAVAGALAAGGYYFIASTPYDDEYMERLDLITRVREIYGNKSTPTWNIGVDIPDNPPLEKWDAQHEMPQLMVKIKKQGNKTADLYAMNLNGTDIRILFTAEEIGGSIEAKGLSRPSRSPDGRYIITAYQPEAFRYSCAIFDLKTRQAQSLGHGRCLSFDWQADSQAVYFTGGKSWQQSFRYDVTSGTAELLSPHEGSELGELRYDSDFVGGRVFAEGKYFIRQLSYEAMQRVPGVGNQGVFRMPDMEYLGRQEYYAEECVNGQAFSADHSTFTCNTIGDEFNYYRFDTPNTVAGNAPQRWIIQEGQWFHHDTSQLVTRLAQKTENTPLPALNYLYQSTGTHQFLGSFSMSISQNLREGYSSSDFRQFFPLLPTPEVYWESAKRQLAEQSRGGKRG